ncbi:oligosaccharide flippase family protein [Kiritimatiellaeota bacterium B1221]|nr:oligosaccharide flippase family protein [Kiritimatiellaeota bacterium B1221]
MSSHLKNQAIKGSIWTLFGYGASQILRLLSNLILARLLFPEAFGLMALVNVFMQGLQMFSDVGIGPSIIQNKRGNDPQFLKTAWTIQVFRGIALWAFCCAAAPLVANFFAESNASAHQLLYILPVTGITAFIGGFTSTSVFTLNRKLDMKRMTLLEIVPQIASLTCMIVWAKFHPSVWALVGGGITFSFVRLFMSHAMSPDHKDGFAWEPEARRELFRFGRWVFLSTVVSFLAGNLDKLLLGKLLTLSELGLYSIAMTLARVAIHTSTRLSSSVIFPLLSRYQDDPPRLVNACLMARRAVLWLSAAICSGFALFAPLFFESLYDDRYFGAGATSRWLAIYTWSHVLIASMDRIPLALGNPRLLFFANLITTLGMGLAVWGYQAYGLPGFILSMALAKIFANFFLTMTLPTGRFKMLGQSVFFTLGFLGYTLACIYGLNQAEASLSFYPYAGLVCLSAAAPILLAMFRAWCLIKAKKEKSA